jgi:hypothetical protein
MGVGTASQLNVEGYAYTMIQSHVAAMLCIEEQVRQEDRHSMGKCGQWHGEMWAKDNDNDYRYMIYRKLTSSTSVPPPAHMRFLMLKLIGSIRTSPA